MNNIISVAYLVLSIVSAVIYAAKSADTFFYLIYIFLILSGIERIVSEIKKDKKNAN